MASYRWGCTGMVAIPTFFEASFYYETALDLALGSSPEQPSGKFQPELPNDICTLFVIVIF